MPSSNITKDDYVSIVLDTFAAFNAEQDKMHARLILSIDRRNTLQEAEHVVDLALKYADKGVVGVDLCGNPLRGDVSLFAPAFSRARRNGLAITLHFGEVAESGRTAELECLLSYQPARIGHVIHMAEDVKKEIQRRRLGLELCLSCNVLAKMTAGGIGEHHFGEWRRTECPIALSVSIFLCSRGMMCGSLSDRLMMWGFLKARCRMSITWLLNTLI